jgi:hypothetical protein
MPLTTDADMNLKVAYPHPHIRDGFIAIYRHWHAGQDG